MKRFSIVLEMPESPDKKMLRVLLWDDEIGLYENAMGTTRGFVTGTGSLWKAIRAGLTSGGYGYSPKIVEGWISNSRVRADRIWG